MKPLFSLSLLGSFLILSACGDTAALVAPTPTPIPLSSLVDESINTSSATPTGSPAEISIKNSSTSAASTRNFVGGGTGHKALLAIRDFDKLKLADMRTVEFDVKAVTGVLLPYLNFIVDLDCNIDEVLASLTIADIRNRRKVLTVNSQDMAGTTDSAGVTHYKADVAANAWTVSGGAFGGLPANSTIPGSPLSNFIANYPNACIVNSTAADGGLKRNGCASGGALATSDSAACGFEHGAMLIVVGNSSTTTLNEITVSNLKITTAAGITEYK